MGYFFLDDSQHAEAGFCLSVFVYCERNPQAELELLLLKHGMEPKVSEFKSSARMDRGSTNAALREDLKTFLHRGCKIGIAISRTVSDIQNEATILLEKMLSHPRLSARGHFIFADQGIFTNSGSRAAIQSIRSSENCIFHLQEDSKLVCGVQLADLAAHICAIMLKDTLGLISKTVKAGENSGYDPDLDIELGFEMYTAIRYSLLAESTPYNENLSYLDQSMVHLDRYGLVISDMLDTRVKAAAKSRFSSVYLGCIH